MRTNNKADEADFRDVFFTTSCDFVQAARAEDAVIERHDLSGAYWCGRMAAYWCGRICRRSKKPNHGLGHSLDRMKPGAEPPPTSIQLSPQHKTAPSSGGCERLRLQLTHLSLIPSIRSVPTHSTLIVNCLTKHSTPTGHVQVDTQWRTILRCRWKQSMTPDFQQLSRRMSPFTA